MKKPVLILLLFSLGWISCSRKTVPPANTKAVTYQPVIKKQEPKEPVKEAVKEPVVVTRDPEPAKPAPVKKIKFSEPMIVIDDRGEIVTPKDQLPDEIAAKVDFKSITRAYTPDQRQNLIYRFKLIPPKVLYVPDQFSTKSARGEYCIYKKKFYYWKKEDGLFYLDETYYR
ncbi:MAG: hypothetical protein KGO92_15815 [Bacteroidota bacterium]|nr:hypothetical protein [Bacteroidota bacterium]